jgi:hypothetical protein
MTIVPAKRGVHFEQRLKNPPESLSFYKLWQSPSGPSRS